ncbi:phage tail length tape measure family protein [Hahella ganghwensis]|uniref:phage tail length tape measure family protein n=1 Tax=Hahella ganghwensis TaxID=286420 RepID=UPI00037C4E50|nr:phage tail length tape measure family protein [Hahella ganghwensis]
MPFKEKLKITLELDSTNSERELRQQVAQYESSAQKIDRANKKMASEMGAIDQASKKAAASTKKMRSAVGQLGFQVQDIAVQLQSGTNLMVALGQQGSQIAGIFGPGGAVIGAFIAVGAALGTAFLPALFESSTATERLEDALEGLDSVLKTTKRGTRELTDEVLELARASRLSAQLEISRGLVDATKAFNEAQGALKETLEDGFGGAFETDINDAVNQLIALEQAGKDVAVVLAEVENQGGTNYAAAILGVSELREELVELQEDFGLSRDQALLFIDAIATARLSPTTDNLNNLEEVVAKLGVEARNTSPAFVEIAAKLAEQVRAAKDAADAQEQLEKALKDVDEALKGVGSSTDEYVKGLRAIRNASVENTELGFIDAAKRGEEVLNGLIKERIKSQEAANKAYESGIRAIRNANVENTELGFLEAQTRGQELINERLKEQIQLQEQLRKVKEEARLSESLAIQESFFALEEEQSAEASKDNPFAAELARYEETRSLIEAAAAENQALRERANAALEAEERRHTDVMRQLQFSQFQPALDGAKMVFGNLSTLMNSENKKLFEIGKKAAIANALIAGAEAVVHSYNFGAQLGGPPLGAAFAAAAAAATLVQIKQIKSQQFGGGGSLSSSANSAAYQPTVPQQPLGPVSETGNRGQIIFDFSGATLNGDPEKLAQELAGAILEPLRDQIESTDFVLVTNTSRNGQDLRGE